MKISWRLLISLIAIGIIAGVLGMLLSGLLHFVQHHAYGYALDGSHVPFRIGVEKASATRRLLVMMICGVIVGVGWYTLHRFGRKLIKNEALLEKPLQKVPFGETVCHVLLQTVTVGMGAPLGREGAPREIAAACASAWARYFQLHEEDARLLVACATGAALAAVYNVPLAGAVFALEVMLGAWSQRAVTATLLTSVVATSITRYGWGDMVQYQLPQAFLNVPLMAWAACVGPIIGVMATFFRRTTLLFPRLPRDDPRIVGVALLAFTGIGLLAMYFPDILGNGRAGNQLGFGGLISGEGSFELFTAKWIAISLALAAGACGGLMTASMMMGNMFAVACAFLWNLFLPAMSVEAAALLGAMAFLAVSRKMTITTLIFALELTRVSGAFLLPLAICVTGAVLAEQWMDQVRFAKLKQLGAAAVAGGKEAK